jgi:hypothetical protein
MAKPDGGPAFPRPASEYTKNGTLLDGNDAVGHQEGMSLRDYFAGQAMQALLVDCAGLFRDVARNAYECADAMLAARDA